MTYATQQDLVTRFGEKELVELTDPVNVEAIDVTATSVLDLDFSSFGEMPYSVPELTAEVGL